jgi:hypothetical protein
MSDQPAKKSVWGVAFVGRLCLIGWICAILYESFVFFTPVRKICLLFGPWALILALINSLAMLMIRRQSIFLVFIVLSIPPSIHFGLVLRNIAIEKKLFESSKSEQSAPTTEAEEVRAEVPKDRELNPEIESPNRN